MANGFLFPKSYWIKHIFFDYDKISFNIFYFDIRYNQSVSGFILRKDPPKSIFFDGLS